MNKTKIEWADATVNPYVGCTGECGYCYAKRLNDRFHFVADFHEPQYFPGRLKEIENKTPKKIFLDSMSDVSDWSVKNSVDILQAMDRNTQHVYLLLTKRPDDADAFFNAQDIVDYAAKNNTRANQWLGVSITFKMSLWRLKELKTITLKYPGRWNGFLSIEPLEENVAPSIDITDLSAVQWVIIGLETGTRKQRNPNTAQWIANIVEKCDAVGIPVFMKDSCTLFHVPCGATSPRASPTTSTENAG